MSQRSEDAPGGLEPQFPACAHHQENFKARNVAARDRVCLPDAGGRDDPRRVVMSPAGYPYSRPPTRLRRALRTLVLAAAAAVVGVVAGGISVLAIVAALTAPPRDDMRAAAAKVGGTAAPTGPVGATTSPPVPAGPPQQQAAEQSPPAQSARPTQAEITPPTDNPQPSPNKPSPNKPWSDAFSRARHPHPAAFDTPKPGQSAAAESVSPAPATAEQESVSSVTAKQKFGGDRYNRKDNRAEANKTRAEANNAHDEDNKASASSSGERAAVSPPDSAARNAEPAEAAKRRVVVTTPARQPKPSDKLNDKAAELPPNKPQLFDFFGDQQVREEQTTIGPGAVAPRASDAQPPAGAKPGAIKPRPTWRRQGDVVVSDQAQRRRVIIIPAPDERRARSEGGFFDFLGPSRRDDW
jgi:hypothetical protein